MQRPRGDALQFAPADERLLAAEAAGDAGRARASLRMIVWRAAPFVGVLFIAAGLWWLRRRRRERAQGPATVDGPSA